MKANCKSLLGRSNTSEVNEHSLLTEIVNDFDEDIYPSSSFETCFEVFTHPKSLDTPEITSTGLEKKILQAL